MSVKGRVALVTGASRGIGRAIAQDLSQRGATVVAVSTRGTADGHAIPCDIGDADQVHAAVSTTVECYGTIHILVNCAGVALTSTLVDTEAAEWSRVIAVNLTGPFLFMKHVIPHMIRQRWGRVVNLCSIAGRQGQKFMSAYGASKHGLLGLTRCAALEVASHGVTVNAICPGPVDTDMLHSNVHEWATQWHIPEPAAERALKTASPQNRWFEPEEVAGLIRYLVSDDARGINGQAINLCGGTLTT